MCRPLSGQRLSVATHGERDQFARRCAPPRWALRTRTAGLTLALVVVCVLAVQVTAGRAWASEPGARPAGLVTQVRGIELRARWRISAVEARRPGEVTAWLTETPGEGAQATTPRTVAVRMVCRDEGAPEQPALAHSGRFDLRVDRPRGAPRGASPTPPDLADAVTRVAAQLRILEGDVDCAHLGGAGRRPRSGDVDPHAAATTRPGGAVQRDARWTAALERATSVPLVWLCMVWVVLWCASLVAWVLRGAPGGARPAAPSDPRAEDRALLRRAVTATAALATLALAAALRTVQVAHFTLNPDEHASVDAAPWRLVFLGDDDSLYHPPLARAMFRAWMGLWPSGDATPRWWWRAPSVVAGVASVGLLGAIAWRAARSLPQRQRAPLALASMMLLAILPQAVFVSDLAKPYALVTTAVLATVWAGLRLADQPEARLAMTYARRRVAAVMLGAVVVGWLDYPAALALGLWAGVALWRSRGTSVGRRMGVSVGGALVGVLPLAPLALTGVQFAWMRRTPGWSALAAGFPSAPSLPPSLGLGGDGADVLRLLVGDLSAGPLSVSAVGGALVVAASVTVLTWRAAPKWPVAAVWGWAAAGTGLAVAVYTRPQNLSFVFAIAQLLLALALVRWSRGSVVALVALLCVAGLARGPQLQRLYANQRQGSVADLNFGPDCHRVVALLRSAPAGDGPVLAQLDGDAHCLIVEAVAGAPHQRELATGGHLPGGASCLRAAGRRWCAGGRDLPAYAAELAALSHGFAVVERARPPRRPARCAVIGDTADFSVWRCAPGRGHP